MMQFLIWWYAWGYILGWVGSLLPIAVAGKRAFPMPKDEPSSMMIWLSLGCMGLQLPIYLGVTRSYRIQALAWLTLVTDKGGMTLVMQQNPQLFWYALMSVVAIPIAIAGARFYLAWRRRHPS